MEYYCPDCKAFYPAENTRDNDCIFCGHRVTRVDQLIERADYMYGEDR
jgi:regulator of replication initiation timing